MRTIFSKSLQSKMDIDYMLVPKRGPEPKNGLSAILTGKWVDLPPFFSRGKWKKPIKEKREQGDMGKGGQCPIHYGHKRVIK